MKLSDNVTLHNVLFVPTLTCNLLSVSQVLEKQHFIVSFTNMLCIIQDHSSKNLIGAGEQCNGIYHFRPIQSVRVFHTPAEQSTQLWHKRLGHPSNKVVSFIPGVSHSTSNYAFHSDNNYLV